MPLWANAALGGCGDGHRRVAGRRRVLALVGRARFAKARSAGPTAALDSVRADVHDFRHAFSDRGWS
jgi:hypothetical protein